MWNQRPSYRFEIDNFSKKESYITCQTFVSGGCEWFLYVYPKGDHRADNHLSLYLHVANPTLLPTGWKRSAKFYFVVLNQSDKELCRTSIGQASTLFCAKALSGGFPKTLPLSKLKEKGILENDKLIIEVYINVLEAVDGEVEDVSEKKETVDINGFQVFASQVRKKFAEHVVKAEYKNVLSNACTKLSELAEEGFKLDWLKSKLDELSLKKKKKVNDVDDGSRVQLLEERIKNLEVLESGSKMDGLKSKLEEISLERKKPHDAYESCVQKLEERVKNLELMELGFKIDSLKTKFDEVTLEMNKSDDDDDSDDGDDDSDDESWAEQLEERVTNLELMESNLKLESLKAELDEVSLERKKENSRAQQFEKRIKDLELMMARLTVELGFKVECLKSKFEEDSLEKKISYDADGSRIWESIEDLAMIVSELKIELDKKKDKSSADGFMLVD